ncbi:MAG: glycosyltransferase [Phycisphaerae bacterium]|nr:glycosyltransferase [Phycisphaerae bacterium]
MLIGANGLIAVSQSLADLADEVVGRELGVRVIPNGVDSETFRRFGSGASRRGPSAETRAACGWPNDVKYVVSVGHLQALKGFHRLIEMWPDVRRRAGDVRLVLVGGEAGEPAYARRLRRQIDAMGLGAGSPSLSQNCGTARPPAATRVWHGRPARGPTGETPVPQVSARDAEVPIVSSTGCSPVISMTGRIEPKRVAALLNAADLFVLASRSEGWCNAVAEALACGCPVVATDVGGNREIVNDPALGRLVPLEDCGALTEAVCWALERDWDRQRIAELGGRRDWQQVARECVDLFKVVL